MRISYIDILIDWCLFKEELIRQLEDTGETGR